MRFLLRIPLAVVLLFLGAAVLTVYLLTQTSLPYYAIDRALSHYIESRYNVKIEFGKLGGRPYVISSSKIFALTPKSTR